MGQVIYCISGLGADERIFKNLRLSGLELKYIPWLRPSANEPMAIYAERMSVSIKDENAILLGVSFGGIMALEIARQRTFHKLILVSSVKSVDELPAWMKIIGKLKINRIIPVRPFKLIEKIGNKRLGVSSREEMEMVRNYRKSVDPLYLEWAVNQVLNWRNDWIPSNIIHIHGDSDKIFPVKRIRSAHILKDATHFMIYNRAEEISEYITTALRS